MSGTDEDEGGASDSRVLRRRRYDWSETPPSVAVVEVLSELDDVALTPASGPTLSEFVDPEALDTLLTHGPGDVATVTVPIEDYEVRIEGAELCVLAPADEAD